MSQTADLYLLERTAGSGGVRANRVWSDDGGTPLGGGGDHLVPLSTTQDSYVFAVDRQTGATLAYHVDADGSALAPARSTIDLNGAWDIVESFEIGGIPHLLTYAAEQGQFGFFPIAQELRSGRPYLVTRPPG